MDITSLIIQLIVGAIGGNAAGKAMPDKSLGTTGNTIAGVVGGVLGGQILDALLGGAAVAAMPQQGCEAAWTSALSSRISPVAVSVALSSWSLSPSLRA